MYIYEKNRILKVLSIITYIFILLALIITLRTPPASGYEISIYGVYPWYFWFCIITSIFLGQMVILINILWVYENRKFWIFGFLAILLTNTILLFMPFIRGYVIYGRGDVLEHIGFIKDILRTGSIENNFYPIEHILSASLSYITTIDVKHIVNIIPPIFSLFYIISIYFLSKEIFENKSEILLTLIFSSILLFENGNLIFAPSVQSFFLLPFVLWIYFKSRRSEQPLKFNILLILLLFLIVFFHPLTTLFLILIFLILEISLFIYKRTNKKSFKSYELTKRKSFNVILISSIALFVWYFSFGAILGSIRSVLLWLMGELEEQTFAESYVSLLTRVKPELFDILQVIFNTYGQFIILGISSLFFTFLFFDTYRKNRDKELRFYHIFFPLGFLIFSGYSFGFYFSTFIGRPQKYFLFFSSLLTAFGFYFIFKSSKYSYSKKIIKKIAFCLFLIILLYFSTFNLYFSPRIQFSNQQVSKAELSGMNWFFVHRDETVRIQELEISQLRFYTYIYGWNVPKKNLGYGMLPPDHFRYENKTLLGEYYKADNYLLISTLGRIVYPELYPNYEKFWKFTPEDFERIEGDNTVSRIYDSEDLNIYFVE